MTISALSNPKNKAFFVVLFIELWERFGYYGMQSILVLFLSKHMRFGDNDANLLIGAFAAMTYAAPALGGWIGDKVIGNRRAMLCGSIILAIGYLLLSAATYYTSGIFVTMAIISVGNGLFKPNAATLVRRIYDNEDSKLDVAFTLYYMAVNVGSTVSMLLCPILKDHYGWGAAFLACCFGLTLGIGNYYITQKRLQPYIPQKDRSPLTWSISSLIFLGILGSILGITGILTSPFVAQWCIVGAAIIVIVLWINMYLNIDQHYKFGLKIMYILTLEGMIFFIFYQQMSTSLTLFAERNIDPAFYIGPYHLFNWSAGQFQALNPIWIMILSPLLTLLYTYLNKRNKDFSIATKFISGFIFVAVAFLIWWVMCLRAQTNQLSSWVMIWGYFFLSFGELLTSGLGLAVIARYVPSSMNGFMTGSYFMASGISLYIGSKIANIAAPAHINDLSADKTLLLYQHLFLNLFIIAVLAVIILMVLIPIVKKWNRHHKENMLAYQQSTVNK
ncbi:peptide MFS transporter [Commensalibacter oyaizuii]|uniref:Peptide MFS transporter n=1 Tax=Commensalibacter oyaizuii TaxID=3043873 RepID=A0ABT6Q2E5_9PROT|nr:peptide MFS transporter [Commensalibacter sp. TBRC 16381]MDI2091158.1 peptide MFS transporter [Commensalibacter sp. TBRC 16381]